MISIPAFWELHLGRGGGPGFLLSAVLSTPLSFQKAGFEIISIPAFWELHLREGGGGAGIIPLSQGGDSLGRGEGGDLTPCPRGVILLEGGNAPGTERGG